MDKKNTMLLTVIAVATLLVAVVGATFAYFSVSGSSSSTATVTTKAESVGTVAAANGTALSLNLTAAHMSETLGGKATYYATTNGTPVTEEPTATTVATFTAAEVADADVTYTCTFDYAITTNEGASEGAIAVLSADSSYVLSTSTDKLTLTNNEYKLAGTSQTGTGTLEITDGTSATIGAVASVSNTTAEQNGLAGAEVTTTFAVSNFACTTK